MTTLDRTVSRPRGGLITNVYEIDALTGTWDNDEEGATADQTASIQAQINAIPDGSLIRFPVGKSSGKYYTQGNLGSNSRGANGIIRINNRKNLVIEGPSPSDPATFYTTQPAVPWGSSVSGNTHSLRRHFWITNSENITLRNLRVEGSNYTFANQLSNGNPFFWLGAGDSGGTPETRAYRSYWELEHAFEFVNSLRCQIYDCEAQDIWGDGLSLGGSAGGAFQFNGQRLLLLGTGRQGVAISRGADIFLDDLQIGIQTLRPRRAGLDLEPVLSWVVERVQITNVDMWHGNMVPVAALGSSKVNDILIDGFWNHTGSGAPIRVGASDGTRRRGWTIRNFTHTPNFGSPLSAASFNKVDDVTLENVQIGVSAAQSRVCIDFNDCRGDLIVKDTSWTGGCWIDYDSNSSTPNLQGTNTFHPTCPTSGLRNQ